MNISVVVAANRSIITSYGISLLCSNDDMNINTSKFFVRQRRSQSNFNYFDDWKVSFISYLHSR